MKPRTTCPDCDAPLEPITLRDYSHGRIVSPPHYVDPDDKPHWFSGFRPVAGTIHAFMCTDCGLVRLYAEPKPPKE